MKRKTYVLIILFWLLLAIQPVSVLSADESEVSGKVTVDIIHHNPQDVIVTLGHYKVAEGIKQISRNF